MIRAVLLLVLALAASPVRAQDAYAEMLDYLTSARIEGHAFARAGGAIAVNQAAGDTNLQTNLRAIAVGERAQATVHVLQAQDDRHDRPTHAQAVIGGRAFEGAGGLVAINQASGSGNAETNAVAMTVAGPGTRDAQGDQTSGIASAGMPRVAAGARSTVVRRAAVTADAFRGFEGALQLNQIAGSGNATLNQLVLSVQGP